MLISPEIVGEPLALSVQPSSLIGPDIVPFPVKSSTLSSTDNTIGLSTVLLNVPAPPIDTVYAPTVRFPPE